VKEDVEYLKKNKGIPDSVKITGWVYQVEDGKVKYIV
jgi:carbonic anhydrase